MGEGGVGDKTEIDQLSLVPSSFENWAFPAFKSQGRGGNGPSGRQAQFLLKAREGGETALRAVKPNFY